MPSIRKLKISNCHKVLPSPLPSFFPADNFALSLSTSSLLWSSDCIICIKCVRLWENRKIVIRRFCFPRRYQIYDLGWVLGSYTYLCFWLLIYWLQHAKTHFSSNSWTWLHKFKPACIQKANQMSELDALPDLLEQARTIFVQRFESDPTVRVFAPGRVNLIGEHVDYNDGFVLPFALPYKTVVIGSACAPGAGTETATCLFLSDLFSGDVIRSSYHKP